MSKTKKSFEEWWHTVSQHQEDLRWTTTPLDKRIYQPYEHNGVRIKVLTPVLSKHIFTLIDRLASRKDVVILAQMLDSNGHIFLNKNYENYSSDPRNVISFKDIWLYCGGKGMQYNKHHISTPVKFQKFVERYLLNTESLCNICLEELPTESYVSCGKCSKSFCLVCSARWHETKGSEVNCPTCRAKLIKCLVH